MGQVEDVCAGWLPAEIWLRRNLEKGAVCLRIREGRLCQKPQENSGQRRLVPH